MNPKILATLPIEGNEDYIKELRRKHERQNIVPVGASERISRLVDNVRSRGGRAGWDDAAIERFRERAGRDTSLSMGQ